MPVLHGVVTHPYDNVFKSVSKNRFLMLLFGWMYFFCGFVLCLYWVIIICLVLCGCVCLVLLLFCCCFCYLFVFLFCLFVCLFCCCFCCFLFCALCRLQWIPKRLNCVEEIYFIIVKPPGDLQCFDILPQENASYIWEMRIIGLRPNSIGEEWSYVIH